MIFTNFAPNEELDDALISLKTLFAPGRWQKGKEITKVKNKIESFFPGYESFLYLSGRAALYQLLKSLQLTAGSEVIVQAFTCEAVVLPIIAAGLKPIYIDINPEDFSLNFSLLRSQKNKNTRVIILQHTFGIVPEKRLAILELAKKNNLFVIEDLAHGFDIDSTLKQPSVNSAFLLSFGRSKMISSVFGGAVLTKNRRIINSLRSASRNMDRPTAGFMIKAFLYKPLAVLIKSTYDLIIGKIIHRLTNSLNLLIPEITRKEKTGSFDNLLNKNYPNGLAVLLLNQLEKIDLTSALRKKTIKLYHEFIVKNPHLQFYLTVNRPIVRMPLLVKYRNQIMLRFLRKNIQIGNWYQQAVAPKGLSLDKVFYKKGSCPIAEKICSEIINLPTLVNQKESYRILSSLKSILQI